MSVVAAANSLLKGWTVPARPSRPRQPGAAVTTLHLRGEITVENSIALFAEIQAAHDNSIELEIDSGGGNALCALALFESLILHPRSVGATIVGRASSGAATVVMGADRRRIAPSGRFMLHETRSSLEGATAEVLRSVLADLNTVDEMSAAIFVAATGQTPDRIVEWKREATTFDAPGAIAAGLAHEIIA